jgi:hypothetical protein
VAPAKFTKAVEVRAINLLHSMGNGEIDSLIKRIKEFKTACTGDSAVLDVQRAAVNALSIPPDAKMAALKAIDASVRIDNTKIAPYGVKWNTDTKMFELADSTLITRGRKATVRYSITSISSKLIETHTTVTVFSGANAIVIVDKRGKATKIKVIERGKGNNDSTEKLNVLRARYGLTIAGYLPMDVKLEEVLK